MRALYFCNIHTQHNIQFLRVKIVGAGWYMLCLWLVHIVQLCELLHYVCTSSHLEAYPCEVSSYQHAGCKALMVKTIKTNQACCVSVCVCEGEVETDEAVQDYSAKGS